MDKINAAVCVGFRAIPGQGGDERLRTLDMLYDSMFKQFEHICVASDGGDKDDPFNRSRAKNNAAEWAKRKDREVLVFADSDTFVPRSHLEFAVNAVAEGKADLALAHNGKAVYLNSGAIRGQGEGGIYGPFPGGIFAISRAAFDEVRGFDEKFVGWGHEDICFLVACQRLFGLRLAMSNEAGPMYKLDLLHDRLFHEYELGQAPESPEGALYLSNTRRRDAYLALQPGDRDGYWNLRETETEDIA